MRKEQGIAHILLLILLLAGIVAGVYLIQSKTNFFSRASASPIVFKNTAGAALPVNSQNIPQSTSPTVKIEFTSTLGPPSGGISSPIRSVSGPVQLTTKSFRFAENPTDLNTASYQAYTKEPTIVDYTFKNTSAGQKFIFVEFLASNGTTGRRSAQIELVSSVLFSNLSATFAKNQATFNFKYTGKSTWFKIDASTTKDMSWDVYVDFAGGGKSPIVLSNPTKWDKYSCGRTLYWRVYSMDRKEKSDIQATTINCTTPTPTIGQPWSAVSLTPPSGSVTPNAKGTLTVTLVENNLSTGYFTIRVDGSLKGLVPNTEYAVWLCSKDGTSCGTKSGNYTPKIMTDKNGDVVYFAGLSITRKEDANNPNSYLKVYNWTTASPSCSVNSPCLMGNYTVPKVTVTSTPTPTPNTGVSLKSVAIIGNQLEVVYSKSFATCAHLLKEPSTMVHVNNFYCTSGTNIKVTRPLTDFKGIAVGTKVKLCNGNNYNLCSSWVTIQSIPTPTPSIAPACLSLQNKIQAAMFTGCGDTKYDPAADVNKDKVVNGLDMSFLIGHTASLTNQAACLSYLNNTSSPCLTPPLTPPPLTPTPQAAKRVFVTSTTYNGNLGGLAGADSKCQTQANIARLGGIWKAWLSSSTTSAASRLSHNLGPYKLINGTVVFDQWPGVSGVSIRNPINITEFGSNKSDQMVFTSSDTRGELYQYNYSPVTYKTCNDWASTVAPYYLTVGGNTTTWPQYSSNWTSGLSIACETKASLYCFEQ